ncbi:MAG: sulfatase-like hydrolase/transferase [Butyricimonas faecihominis]
MDQPFFSFVFYDLLHAIDIPAPYRKKFQPSWDYANYLALNNNLDPEPFFNLYRNCAYYVDSLVGKIVNKLEENGLLEHL